MNKGEEVRYALKSPASNWRTATLERVMPWQQITHTNHLISLRYMKIWLLLLPSTIDLVLLIPLLFFQMVHFLLR